MSRRLETGPTACSLKANIQEEYPLQNFEEMLRTRDEETRHVNFVLGDCEIGADDQQVYFNAHIAESGKQTKEESLHLTNESFRQLCNIINFPIPFANRIDPELLKLNMNYLLSHSGNAMYSALLGPQGVRAFKDPTYPYIPSLDIYQGIVNQVNGAYETGFDGIDELRVQAVVMPLEFHDDFGGSTIQGGVRFSHVDSWLDDKPIKFESFLHRETGGTGMIVDRQTRKLRVAKKAPGDVLAQAKEFAKEAVKHVPDMMKGFKDSLEEPVERPETVVRRITKEKGIPKKVQNILIDQLSDTSFQATIGGREPKNMHDIIALFMFVGTHNADVSFGNSEQLLAAAGELASDHKHRCDLCGHQV